MPQPIRAASVRVLKANGELRGARRFRRGQFDAPKATCASFNRSFSVVALSPRLQCFIKILFISFHCKKKNRALIFMRSCEMHQCAASFSMRDYKII